LVVTLWSALTIGLMRLCERIGADGKEGRS